MQWRLRAEVGLAPLRSSDFLPYCMHGLYLLYMDLLMMLEAVKQS